jgi:hypothetical protein
VTRAGGDFQLYDLSAGTYPITPALKQYSFAPPQQAVTVGGSKIGVNFAATLEPYEIHLAHVIDGAYNYSEFMPIFISN